MDESPILSAKEIVFCMTKKSPLNQIACAIMLGYFKIHLRFPLSDEVFLLLKLSSKVATELELEQQNIFEFDWSSRTVERYRNNIRQLLGYREATNEDASPYINYLQNEVLPKFPSKEIILAQSRLYFKRHKIEQFSVKQINRYITSAQQQFEQSFFQSIFDNLTPDDCYLIDQILTTSTEKIEKVKGDDIIALVDLKKDIPGARLKNVNLAIKKIEQLIKIKLSKDLYINKNRKLLIKYYDRIMALAPSNILEFSTIAKYATMAIFCHIRLQYMLDDLTDTFTKLIHSMRTNAEKSVRDYVLGEVERVGGKFNILKQIAMIAVNHPKGVIEDKIYPEVSKEKLIEIIEDLEKRGSWFNEQVQDKIKSTYSHGNRTVLLAILRALSFREEHLDYKPIIKAIEFINKHWDSSDTESYLTMPPIENIIPEIWQAALLSDGKQNSMNKYKYEVIVLEQLKAFLGYKAIWIENSYRYRNPKDDLPLDFKENKQKYLEMLNLPNQGNSFTKQLKKLLSDSLSSLNTNIVNNDKVTIKSSKVNKNFSVSPSDAQKEPQNIVELQKEIIKRWSSINLIDILKECDLLINFTQEMDTIGKNSNINATDLRKRLLLCLYGIGSNTGLKRISIANGDVSYSDLRYVKSRFINKINVRNAIRAVVDKVLEIRDPEVWGVATTSVACDSTQISAWDQNLMNEWHHRYKGKGVMIYWHVDKKALCIYSQLKTCSSSEVGSMIKGVIDHDTKMNMDRVFVDTHGQSVLGFAVGYMLDFDLLPRFKAINKQKICGVTSSDKQKYENISLIMKGTINWKIIEENYEEVVKHIIALKLGIIEPSVLVKRFSKDNFNHPVYKALMEIGKANKSIFLCKYLQDENLRIEINEGLNVVERLNHVMDFIFYGKLGELKTNQTDDQELSVLCLHLLQACMVYINTLIIQQVLSEPHWNGRLTPEDYRALTPLLSTHINPYGLFPIDFNERLAIYTNLLKEAENDYHSTNTCERESKTALETA
ncbi:Tn3 family transposase [Caedibacter taeniospiralis]|uniref:Tn3 family transposase n=1 Tax=Caedibacter taeniospiralis TaxID=28907 RepID=UPI000C275860|nr:Tn3 family transposase [Caedibacter taeniospiralis]